MKPIYLAALLAFGTVSCVDNLPKLQILQAAPPEEDCNVPDDVALLSGSLNLALAGDYTSGFIVTSNLSDTPIVVGEAPVSDIDSTAVYLTELELSYQTEPELNIPSATIPIYGTFRGNEDGSLVLGLLTRDAESALRSAVGGGGTVVDVLVTLRVRGHTVAGGDVETNEISYPLVVGFAPYVCPTAGDVHGPLVGPCDPRGQNGAVPECVTP
ncbi:hypothetical protein [Myxococcus sp. CA040A]|uniref:hypothetical protein n=1 Tax=Myxococcus sp. CA040A TaxID=2741738 RepID=UPI00157A3282|nr:hypothetical protein [Myxococcus sp. CA040A]NTX00604.1 hypothetical protein [Myxococcus sp. CA040A]